MYLDAARRCKLKEIFENFISSLTLMAKDAILVREIWRDKITEEKIVRGKDGFLYANDELIKRIEAAVQLEEFRLREEAEAAAEDERSSMIQMLIRNGSRQGPVFPIEKHLPSVSQEVFQARDFIYVIGVNEPCVKNKKGNRRKSCRLFNANIAALKRQTFRVLSDIAKRYPDEIEEVRVKGPKLGGQGSIYLPWQRPAFDWEIHGRASSTENFISASRRYCKRRGMPDCRGMEQYEARSCHG